MLWRWKTEGDRGTWAKVDWRDSAKGNTAILVCPGPSLKALPYTGPGRTVFGINTSYPLVRPDVWVGMDKAECYDGNLFYEPFPKIMRGSYHSIVDCGVFVRELPETYFADVINWKGIEQMFEGGDGLRIPWANHTLGAALTIIPWMGFERIVFVGCDQGGNKDYYDDRRLTDDQRNTNRRLYSQQTKFLREYVAAAKTRGIVCQSGTVGSPINEIMEEVDVEGLLADATKPHREVLHAIDAHKDVERRVGVVVPTRGDRGELMRMCQMMIDAQTRQPDHLFVIDRPPVIEGNDQRDRVSEGVAKAKAVGCTHILIMEDDDYYPPDYIEKVMSYWKNEEVIGGYYYDIYHIGVRKHLHYNADMDFGTGTRCSPLHSTGFTVAAWDRFLASVLLGSRRNLDGELWEWAQGHRIARKFIPEHMVLSIKHGIGKAAGGAHNRSKYDNRGEDDPQWEYLRSVVGDAFVSMYQQLAKPDERQSLIELADGQATDKGTCHSYTEVYGELLAPIRDTAENVLEIGVDKGGSILLWQRYFSKAEITGVDKTLRLLRAGLDESRSRVLEMDAYCDDAIERLGDRKYDLIVEDGDHTLGSMMYVAANYSPLLTDRGMLVIEDVPSVDIVPDIVQSFPPELREFVTVLDRRDVKGRFDDMLIVLDKRKAMQKPVILHYNNWAILGGVETTVVDIARELVEYRHVLCTRNSKHADLPFLAWLEEQGIEHSFDSVEAVAEKYKPKAIFFHNTTDHKYTGSWECTMVAAHHCFQPSNTDFDLHWCVSDWLMPQFDRSTGVWVSSPPPVFAEPFLGIVRPQRVPVVGRVQSATGWRSKSTALFYDALTKLERCGVYVVGKGVPDDVPGEPIQAGKMPELLRNIDIMAIWGNTKESWSKAVTEANLCGIPVVARNHKDGQAEQLSKSGGGVLVSTIEGFIQNVQHLVDHPDERDELGARGREWCAKHATTKQFREDVWNRLGIEP